MYNEPEPKGKFCRECKALLTKFIEESATAHKSNPNYHPAPSYSIFDIRTFGTYAECGSLSFYCFPRQSEPSNSDIWRFDPLALLGRHVGYTGKNDNDYGNSLHRVEGL